MTNTSYNPYEVGDMLLRLLHISGFGSSRVNRLIQTLLNLETRCSSSSLANFKEVLFTHLTADQKEEYHQAIIPSLDNLKTIHPYGIITILDDAYPPYWRYNLSSPSLFFYMGNLQLLNDKRVGFSGLRKVSERGLKTTLNIAKELVNSNITIVSGNANGVDEMAHYTALKGGGATILVLPYGITYFEIKSLMKSIWDWDRVLVVSQFSPLYPFSPHRAMDRNETIIRLSELLIVTEAGERGGSLSTGLKGLTMHWPTFVPQYVDSKTALGNRQLLSKGATPIVVNRDGIPNLSPIHATLNHQGLLF